MSVVRGRPPGLAGGIRGASTAYCSSLSACPAPKSPTKARLSAVHMACLQEGLLPSLNRWHDHSASSSVSTARTSQTASEMIRYRALLIAAGYPDANDCDALRRDPAFKMAVGRLPESGADLCSQPTISRLENLPGATALKRMMAAMVDLFCDSFDQVPRRILLDIDDTEDRVHGGQQLSLWNAHYDSRCFLPIHIYEATTGKPVAVILRPGKTPDGTEVALILRHVIGRIRARWPTVDIVVRGDSHYGRPEAMAWCERQRVGYISAWPATGYCCARSARSPRMPLSVALPARGRRSGAGGAP